MESGALGAQGRCIVSAYPVPGAFADSAIAAKAVFCAEKRAWSAIEVVGGVVRSWFDRVGGDVKDRVIALVLGTGFHNWRSDSSKELARHSQDFRLYIFRILLSMLDHQWSTRPFF